ncbi:MAG: hypothetical protein Q8936_14200 [Bacillota bacterium]|nr:hypothetical protein [Bacillota bacterium]
MKLEEALAKQQPNQYLCRRNRNQIKLCSSAKTIEALTVVLTDESRNADDWEIYDYDAT